VFLWIFFASVVCLNQGFSDEESAERVNSSNPILSEGIPLHTAAPASESTVNNIEKRPRSALEVAYKHLITQENTPFNRFMGDFVGTFLVIGLMAFLPGTLIVYLMDLDAFWKKLSVFYIIVYTFFLLNYMIWLISKNESLSKSFMMFSGFLYFFLGVFIMIFRKGPATLRVPKDKTEYWLCSKCKSENRHSVKCWNCGVEKS
jgi:hypothetical protein